MRRGAQEGSQEGAAEHSRQRDHCGDRGSSQDTVNTPGIGGTPGGGNILEGQGHGACTLGKALPQAISLLLGVSLNRQVPGQGQLD